MSSKNVILMNTAGDQIYPATTAEQVAYNSNINVKQAIDRQSGHATVANEAADMTDQTAIYVYTGNETGYNFGHWYYYNGSAWTDGGVYLNGTDNTLSVAGMAADAKVTGDEISDLKSAFVELLTATTEDEGKCLTAKTVTNGRVTEWEWTEGGSGGDKTATISEELKTALLQLASKVAYIDDDGQSYIDDLYTALYPDVDSISAVYTQSGIVYNTDSLDSLRSDLVVILNYVSGNTEIVTDYTLNGTLSVGTSTITVQYVGKSTTFNVVVSEMPIMSLADGDFDKYDCTLGNALPELIIRTTSNRRAFVVSTGEKPYSWQGTLQPSQYYPIPIPSTANEITVKIIPDTMYLGIATYIYDQQTDGYIADAPNTGWVQGTATVESSAKENRYLFVVSKYDASGSTYPSEPTNVIVEYSER